MKKVFLVLLLLSLSVNASILLKNENVCIEDYYYKNSKLILLLSSNDTWYNYSEKNINLEFGYKYDSDTLKCVPNKSVKLGLNSEYYNFLYALIGVMFGAFFMFFMNSIFISVGKK